MLEHGRGTIRLEDVEAARHVAEGEDSPGRAADADALERPAVAD